MSAFSNLARLIKKDFIDCGAYAVSSKLPTIRELAVKYGYSTPTVGKSIDLLVKQGWLNKSQGSGIYIEALPKSKRDLRIGFIASTLDVKLAHDCLRGVNYTVTKNNSILEVADSNYSVQEEYKQVSRMHERGLDGIVLYCLDRMNASRAEYLGSEFRDTPIVVVDLYMPEMNRPHVVFDNFIVGREMTQYLLREGRRNIAFLKFIAPHSAVDERFAGYKRAMSDAGMEECVLEFDPRSSRSNEDLLEIFGKVFGGKNAPDAIELPCDSVFVQVFPLLSKMGISVPTDVILTGTDNLCQFHGGHVWPTTNPDFMRMGERAAEMLLKCIKSNSQKDTEIVLPCPIMIQHLAKKTNIVQYTQQKVKGRLSVLQSI
jgi:DNA-binding LacI/PurR family transcriptional regulator